MYDIFTKKNIWITSKHMDQALLNKTTYAVLETSDASIGIGIWLSFVLNQDPDFPCFVSHV